MYESLILSPSLATLNRSDNRIINRSHKENVAEQETVSSGYLSHRPRYLQGSTNTGESTASYETKASHRRYQKNIVMKKQKAEEEREKSILPHSSASRFAMARQKYIQQQHRTGMTNAERANPARNSPGIFGRSSIGSLSNKMSSSAGIAILLFSLTGIIFFFLIFYLLSRLCTTKPLTHLEESNIVRKGLYKFNTMALNEYSPQTVLYPKRIYELQAEEGLLSDLPQCSLTQENSVLNSANLINPILSIIDFEGKEQWIRSVFQRHLEIEGEENNHNKLPPVFQSALQCGRQLVRKLTGIELDVPPEQLKQLQNVCMNREYV